MANDTNIEKFMAKELTLSGEKFGEGLALAYMSGAACACALFELGKFDAEDRDAFIDTVFRTSKSYSESEDSQETRVLRMMFAYLDHMEAQAEENNEAERRQFRAEFTEKGWVTAEQAEELGWAQKSDSTTM